MPNLKQLLSIKDKYPGTNYSVKSADVKMIIEAFDPQRITKAFSFQDGKVKKYIEFFKKRKRVEAVLLFIDVTSFSNRFKEKTPDEIATFLDAYYDRVFPLIGEYGGEIEKIIGDGIVCVFGEPFLSLTAPDLHKKAEECAMTIIASLKGSPYESKIALHYGEIMYYQNDSDEYYEFTMIGNTLTELFRLESVSHTNSLNFYTKTICEQLQEIKVTISAVTNAKASWILKNPEAISLKGVVHNAIRRIEKV